MTIEYIDVSEPSDAKIDCLVRSGIKAVGRYYNYGSGKKVLTRREAQVLINNNISIWTVFEYYNNEAKWFTTEYGKKDAARALQCAQELVGQPEGTTIYFAADYDEDGRNFASAIVPYFEAVRDVFRRSDGSFPFRIGVYSNGLVCRKLLAAGLVSDTWLSCSTGFTEHAQFYASRKWSISQTCGMPSVCGLDTDNDEVGPAHFGQFSNLVPLVVSHAAPLASQMHAAFIANANEASASEIADDNKAQADWDVEPSLDTREGVEALQKILIRCGYLDPPADGGFGPVTKWALRQFAERSKLVPSEQLTLELVAALRAAQPLPLNPGNDLAGRIVRTMQRNNYWIARHSACVNIVYIEGMYPDGAANNNEPNVFNDTRLVFRVREDGTPIVVGQWEATTEPGTYWTLRPMNAGGAFHIKFGQYKAWIRGPYHTQDALIQVGEIEGYRDPNKTFKRDYNHPVSGSNLGVEQHGGYNYPRNDLGKSSAGCLVGRLMDGHAQFMSVVIDDARYKANPAYQFMSTIMPVADLSG